MVACFVIGIYEISQESACGNRIEGCIIAPVRPRFEPQAHRDAFWLDARRHGGLKTRMNEDTMDPEMLDD